jgi:hypothetical protein
MKNLLYLIFCITISIQGQSFDDYHKRDLIIIKDSLWIKNKLWNYANSYNYINKDQIIFDSTLNNVSFIDIPVFAFKSEAINYDYGLNLFSFLMKDSTRVSGFILKNDTIVGHIEGFICDNSWKYGIIGIFQKHNPPYFEYEKLSPELKKTVYTITPIGFLWYNLGNLTYVALPLGRFIPAETLIKNYVGLDIIKDYYSKKEKPCLVNRKKKGYIHIDTIYKSFRKNQYDSSFFDNKY